MHDFANAHLLVERSSEDHDKFHVRTLFNVLIKYSHSINHCSENQERYKKENIEGYYLRNREIRGNAHAAIHLRTINPFLKLVYLCK